MYVTQPVIPSSYIYVLFQLYEYLIVAKFTSASENKVVIVTFKIFRRFFASLGNCAVGYFMYVNIYLKQAITPNPFITQRKYRNTKTSTISQTI